jgi:hypothetical protein
VPGLNNFVYFRHRVRWFRGWATISSAPFPSSRACISCATQATRSFTVGKAKNLRQRLCSYRYVKPGSASRKTVRLVHTVESISWEVLESDLQAQIRENLLLRTHRPKFNRAHVYPQAYCFVAVRSTDQQAEIALTRKPLDGFTHFGAFKNSVLFAVAALRRLLWAMERTSFVLSEMPASLLIERMSGKQSFTFSGHFAEDVCNYLRGERMNLLECMAGFTTNANTAFERQFIENDLELLQNFFERSTEHNREMRVQCQITEQTIAQEQLNDFLLHARFASAEASAAVTESASSSR